MAVDLIRIDVGSSPNDGQGTPLREAFEIVNTNFAALAQEQDLTNVNNAENIGNVGVGLFAEKVERILEFKQLKLYQKLNLGDMFVSNMAGVILGQEPPLTLPLKTVNMY
jgi:hypothetical protein